MVSLARTSVYAVVGGVPLPRRWMNCSLQAPEMASIYIPRCCRSDANCSSRAGVTSRSSSSADGSASRLVTLAQERRRLGIVARRRTE